MCSNCKQPTHEALGSKNIDDPTSPSESMWPFVFYEQMLHGRTNIGHDVDEKEEGNTRLHFPLISTWRPKPGFFFCCCCSSATVKTAILFLTTVLVEAPSERFDLAHEPRSVSVVKLWRWNRHYSDVRFHRVRGSIAELFRLWWSGIGDTLLLVLAVSTSRAPPPRAASQGQWQKWKCTTIKVLPSDIDEHRQ